MKLRRFKVIKEYPCSPIVGSIYVKSQRFNRYELESKPVGFSPDTMQNAIIEKFPEYFEEIESVNTEELSKNKIAYIEEKFTIWGRKTFNTNEVSVEMFKEAAEKGCPNTFDGNYEMNYDSIGEMSIEMNEDNPTIEVYDYDGNIVWNNKDGWLYEKG
jgi:hypothetical protein